MKTILFQGDSITDAMRWREDEQYRGSGYATLVSATLGYDNPGEYLFFNRGIGGDRSVDLLARIKQDIIHLKPDYMSILIGINDVWLDFEPSNNGVSPAIFEKYYNLLIEQVKEALPDIQIMILEPFILRGTATSWEEEHWREFRSKVEKQAEVVKAVAKRYDLPFVPLMKKFDDAAEKTSPECWTIDGVHPTAAGHELIKIEWLKAFKMLEKDNKGEEIGGI